MAVHVGSFTIADLNSYQRKYNLTAEDMAILRDIRIAPMIGITRLTSKPKKVSDANFVHWEDKPYTRTGTLQGDNGAGTAAALTVSLTTINITNAADFLVANDLLLVDCFDANNTNTSNVRMEGEVMIVATTPTSDVVTVIRNNGQSSTTYNITADSGSTVTWQLIGNANAEGGAARTAKGYNLENKYNVLQYQQETFEATDQASQIDIYGQNPYQRERRLKFQKMLWEMEMSFLKGHRREGTIGGRARPTMGGLMWFLNQADSDAGIAAWTAGPTGTDLVTGTGTSRIWNVGPDWDSSHWLQFLEQTFINGNQEKYGYCGKSFLRKLEELYEDRIRFDYDTETLGLTINAFESHGVRINFVRQPAFDTLWPRDLLIVDQEFVKYAYLNDVSSVDLKSVGVDKDGNRVKRGQHYADFSGQFKFMAAHSWLTQMDA